MFSLNWNFARTWKNTDGIIWLTPTELHTLATLLLRKSAHPSQDVREWVKDITAQLVKQLHRRSDNVVY